MISVNNLSLYFGEQSLFDNISFMINKKDKIGLVGKNGAGKSTLLKLIANEISPNSGDINITNNIIIGYLKQELDYVDNTTLLEDVESSFIIIKEIESQLKEKEKQLKQRKDFESEEYLNIINEFNELQERFYVMEGHEIHSEINQVLTGLGFKKTDLKRNTDQFSGGWRMRIELAKILLKKPDILLLDEPTNHLDIESIIWIEKWLKEYHGSLVLVSHDRRFLDTITNRTIEVAFGKINDYKASYSKYIGLRKDRIEKQIQAKKNQDKFIKEKKILINKFRAKKNKAAFAQTLIRKLEKLDIIEVEQEDISRINFRFPSAPNAGKISLKIKGVSKSYDDVEVLDNINLEVCKSEKIAFVGKNGEGKSTLAKIIVQSIEYEGEVSLGHKIKIGYYDQNEANFLDKNKSILQTMEDAVSNITSSEIRTILGSFLFSNDAVNKKIKVLSGGEKARVALCKMLVNPMNLLIMDEPTHHLDIISKDLLKKALLEFDGTLIIISHDREFLQGLSEKVYEFKNKKIKEYLGDVDSFLKERNLQDFKQLQTIKKSEKSKKELEKKISHQQKKKEEKEIRKLSNRINKLEQEIDSLEKELKEINLQLENPKRFKELSEEKDFFNQYEKKQSKLKEIESEWEKSNMELEKLIK